MQFNEYVINCSVNRKFRVIKYFFDYNQDSELINNFIKNGDELAKKLNPSLARDASRIRDFATIRLNSIGGLIAEYCWRHWLTIFSKKLRIDIKFNETIMRNPKNQIDIEIVYPDETKKKAEVRSSFPYTGIDNAVCRVFDIIGWYENIVKIKEIKKDFYVRALFPFHVDDFLSLLKIKFDLFLTGGATRDLLEKSPFAKYKILKPFDEIILNNSKPTKYRVIEPIINAYDTIKVSEIIASKVE